MMMQKINLARVGIISFIALTVLGSVAYADGVLQEATLQSLMRKLQDIEQRLMELKGQNEPSFGFGRGVFTSPVCQTANATSSIVYLDTRLASSTVTCAADRAEAMTIVGFVRSTTTPTDLQFEYQVSHNNVDWFDFRQYKVNPFNSNTMVDTQGTSTIYFATTTALYKLPIRDTSTTSFAIPVPELSAPFFRVRFNVQGNAAFWAARIDRQPQ